jgi:peptidoglycan/xylan/chitin deacetylase (PgdA/CDA1 family)
MKHLEKIEVASFTILVCVVLLYVANWEIGVSRLTKEEDIKDRESQEQGVKETETTTSVRVPIIVYHSVRPKYFAEPKYQDDLDITPEMFEKHLMYFRDNDYTSVSFDDLADYFSSGSSSLPSKPIILSFDDGWENQYNYAFPLLKKYNMTATFFVFTNAIGKPHYLTWDEINEMILSGNKVGSHSQSHPFLTKIRNKAALYSEIVYSKKKIEAETGVQVTSFAYPFGQYNDDIVYAVKESGYKTARGAKRGIYHGKDDLYTLRTIISSDDFGDLVRGLSK